MGIGSTTITTTPRIPLAAMPVGPVAKSQDKSETPQSYEHLSDIPPGERNHHDIYLVKNGERYCFVPLRKRPDATPPTELRFQTQSASITANPSSPGVFRRALIFVGLGSQPAQQTPETTLTTFVRIDPFYYPEIIRLEQAATATPDFPLARAYETIYAADNHVAIEGCDVISGLRDQVIGIQKLSCPDTIPLANAYYGSLGKLEVDIEEVGQQLATIGLDLPRISISPLSDLTRGGRELKAVQSLLRGLERRETITRAGYIYELDEAELRNGFDPEGKGMVDVYALTQAIDAVFIPPDAMRTVLNILLTNLGSRNVMLTLFPAYKIEVPSTGTPFQKAKAIVLEQLLIQEGYLGLTSHGKLPYEGYPPYHPSPLLFSSVATQPGSVDIQQLATLENVPTAWQLDFPDEQTASIGYDLLSQAFYQVQQRGPKSHREFIYAMMGAIQKLEPNNQLPIPPSSPIQEDPAASAIAREIKKN